MTKVPTLTIGIPAYNEAGNIGHLLADLKLQQQAGFKLIKVIVVSDGSTDATDSIVKKYRGLPLTLHVNAHRQGIAGGLNQIMQRAKSDIVVTLDADIQLKDKLFIARLIAPISQGIADYTTSSIDELESDTFLTQALRLSMQIKRRGYLAKDGGHNLYTSFGLARAYSRSLAHQLRFPTSVGNDMYSYLYAATNGFRFIHVPRAVASYHLPRTYAEHDAQSIRYFHARKKMEELFSEDVVSQAFKLPLHIYATMLLTGLMLFVRYPLHLLMYAGHLLYSYLYAKRSQSKDQWSMARTTKGFSEADTVSIPTIIRSTLNTALGWLQRALGVKSLQVIILAYHGIGGSDNYYNVTESAFEDQMQHLATHYTFVSLDQIDSYLKDGHMLKLPAVVITFDDGYKSILNIRQVIKKYHISPTVFTLSNPRGVNRAELSNHDTLLSQSDLKLLRREGWSVGSHSATHPDLSTLNDMQLQAEIVRATPHQHYFAYPKGRYNQRVLSRVQQAGYSLALSMDDGQIVRGSNPLQLPRIGINASHSLAEFSTLFYPLNSFVRKWIKRVVYV